MPDTQSSDTESKDRSEPGETKSEAPEKAKPSDSQPDKSADQKEPEDKSDDGKDKDAAADAKRRKRRPFVWAIGILVLLMLGAGGGYYWYTTKGLESTDDAYTDGRAVVISPRVTGIVVSLDVTDNQFVHKGDPLIHIDPRQFDAAREQAEGTLASAKSQYQGQVLGAEIAEKNYPAQLEAAQAQLANAKAVEVKTQADYNRQKSLPKLATDQTNIDQATAALAQAEAQVKQAEAQVLEVTPVPQRIGQATDLVGQLNGQVEQAQGALDQANLNLDWTVVRAPQDGWITQRNVEMGNLVAAGQQIFAIVSPEVWITANFKETQLDLMRPGQSVKISIDAYPQLHLTGHVDSIQKGSGSKFSAFPAQNATGNFVKIVQRVPVKIVIDHGLDPNLPLPLGLSVDPTVTVQ
jgi:membrane fusion protein (multidrug efflux system)